MDKKNKNQNIISLYNKKIESLLKISKTITSEVYLEKILKIIVNVTAEAMNSKICSLMLVDEKKKELVIKSTQSVSEEYIKKPNIKLGEGIAGRVAIENKPICVMDVKKDERYINRDIAIKEKLCSLLSVPISIKGKVIGVINCYTSKPHKFTKSEIELLTIVANQTAVAIENYELVNKTKIIQVELETRKYIERAKDILAKELKISHDEAYRKIQKQSMDSRKTMREIAEAIITTHKLRENIFDDTKK